ncbi:MAG: hypothetical protein ACLQVF_32125 [Isosphaeraceae bacterium]
MAITITISTNKQIKTTDGGSIGATAGLTTELQTPITATDAELQREFRHHYETITGAMFEQLRILNTRSPLPPPPTNGTPKTTTNTPTAPPTPKTNGTPAPGQAQAATNGKTNGAAPAPKPAPPPPTQPTAQRVAMDKALAAQFQPNPNDVNEELPDDQSEDDDDGDDTPRTGRELLGWARSQPGDAKQELSAIGMHLRHPALIIQWSPQQVAKAYHIYRRTNRD